MTRDAAMFLDSLLIGGIIVIFLLIMSFLSIKFYDKYIK